MLRPPDEAEDPKAIHKGSQRFSLVRIFARNVVLAKSRFWYFMKRLNKAESTGAFNGLGLGLLLLGHDSPYGGSHK